MEVLDLNDEAAEINTGGYLVPRLYAAVVTISETIYKLLSKSLKKLLTKLQREDAFTQFKIQKLRGGRFINAGKNTRKNPRSSIL